MHPSLNHIPKRICDVAVAATVLVVLSPLLAVAAAVIRLTLGAPVFFSQTRPGLGGSPFTIYKLRTMKDTRNPDGDLLPDEKRLTRLGRFLRVTSFDELLELFNVLKGDMSLVGPRPLLTRYLPFYSEREQLRHTVRPGVTGWAQIHGRNLLAWDHRLAMDVWYVEHWSMSLDLRILVRTLWQVLRHAGVAVHTPDVEPDLSELRGRPLRPM